MCSAREPPWATHGDQSWRRGQPGRMAGRWRGRPPGPAGRPAGPVPDIGPEADNIDESGLDVRSYALVRLASLVTAGAPGQGYDRHIAAALDRGVTLDEIIGVLVALLPTAGVTRVTEA